MNPPPRLASLLVAARGGTSIDTLAYRAGLSGNAIRQAEAGGLPRENTLKAILKAARPGAELRAAIVAAADRERAAANAARVAARAVALTLTLTPPESA